MMMVVLFFSTLAACDSTKATSVQIDALVDALKSDHGQHKGEKAEAGKEGCFFCREERNTRFLMWGVALALLETHSRLAVCGVVKVYWVEGDGLARRGQVHV